MARCRTLHVRLTNCDQAHTRDDESPLSGNRLISSTFRRPRVAGHDLRSVGKTLEDATTDTNCVNECANTRANADTARRAHRKNASEKKFDICAAATETGDDDEHPARPPGDRLRSLLYRGFRHRLCRPTQTRRRSVVADLKRRPVLSGSVLPTLADRAP